MRKFGITDPLYMAFYAREIYQDVVRNWRGMGLLYILSLVALFTIPSMVKFHNQLGTFVANDAPAYVRQMPTLTITKGTLSVPEKQPYSIADPTTNEVTMIIDTTGEYRTLEQAKSRILLTADQMLIRTGTEPVALSFTQIEDMTMDHPKMYDMLEILSEWAAITFYPAAVFLAFVYRVVQMIFFTCLALVYARMAGRSLGLMAGMRISAIAMTPMVAIFTLTGFFDVPVPMTWLFGTALTVSYIIFGIRSLEPSSSQQTSEQH